ncbi:MAG: GNAT family N-acetyltransferase [Prevotellaceae bacterium]|jgi:phosphinothricin acetyltransferase|nr:GNAT family N-acetyltransferase [Prevotellaceae bacterium]
MIRRVNEEDAGAVAAIYSYYVAHTTISFETEPVSEEDMRERIARISAEYPYFVYEKDGVVVGYCYAALWKKRRAYSRTVESTVYISPDHRREGIGIALMDKLIGELRKMCVHAVIACIYIPNDGSVAMHEKLGFTKASHFRQVGWKFGRWLDVGDWELVLDNR